MRRGGWLGWRCPLIVEILEVFPVGGVARVFFCNSSFLSPFPPPLYHMDVDLLTYFFCSTDVKNDKAC